MKKLLTVVLMLLLAFSIFAGGNAEEETMTTEETQEAVAPGLTVINRNNGWEIGKKGGEIVLGELGTGPKTFNGVLIEDATSQEIYGMISAGPATRNQHTLEFEPSLAESWEISADEKSITYNLREGLVWSDGAPLTAHDWEYTVHELFYNDAITNSTRDSLTVGGELAVFEALDDLTLKVTFAEVTAGLLTKSALAPMPKHIIEPIIEAEGVDGFLNLWGIDADPTVIPSIGPWKISEYVDNQRIAFEPNPTYFRKDAEGTQLPYLEKMTWVFIPDTDTMLQSFMGGEVDVYGVRGEDYAVLVDEQANMGFTIYEVGPVASTQFITFNQNPDEDGDGEDAGITGPKLEWLSNDDFRLAMAHLIDRQTIINNIAFGFGYPQYSFIPSYSPYYWQGVEEAAPKYDPIAAAEILDGINYIDRDGDGIREDENGNKISLDLTTNAGNRVREDIGTLFAQEALNVGIEINFRPIDFNELVTQLVATYDWDLILIGLTGSVDPISGSNVYPSNGNLHMIEPNQETPRRDWEARVDAAWAEANETTDEAQRKSGFEKIQREWIENLPWVYTYNALSMSAYDSGLGNVYPQPIDYYGAAGISEYLYWK